MKQRRVTIEYYICPGCGLKFPIPRKNRREKGHLKDIWCPVCKETKKMKQEDWVTTNEATIQYQPMEWETEDLKEKFLQIAWETVPEEWYQKLEERIREL